MVGGLAHHLALLNTEVDAMRYLRSRCDALFNDAIALIEGQLYPSVRFFSLVLGRWRDLN